jgi:hypothetical protein
VKRFGVWNGTTINPAYSSLEDIHRAVLELMPPGKWTPEWYPKAGEGGTWQAAWDGHGLALDGFGKLLALVEEGKRIGLNVVPYVIIRGRPEWREAEFAQIAECAVACRRVILNLEPGSHYWNGPTTAEALLEEYIRPMWDRIRAAFGPDPSWKKVFVQLGYIPRQWVVDALGGDDNDRNILSTLDAWVENVGGISWETYDGIAHDLCVADSMARVDYWLADTKKARRTAFKVPIVQRNRIHVWAHSSFAAHGLEVWHLDGDI